MTWEEIMSINITEAWFDCLLEKPSCKCRFYYLWLTLAKQYIALQLNIMYNGIPEIGQHLQNILDYAEYLLTSNCINEPDYTKCPMKYKHHKKCGGKIGPLMMRRALLTKLHIISYNEGNELYASCTELPMAVKIARKMQQNKKIRPHKAVLDSDYQEQNYFVDMLGEFEYEMDDIYTDNGWEKTGDIVPDSGARHVPSLLMFAALVVLALL